MADLEILLRVGSVGALAGTMVVAWRVLAGSYRAAMADAATMESRYEGRLTALDEEVSRARERAEACEERETRLRLDLIRAGIPLSPPEHGGS